MITAGAASFVVALSLRVGREGGVGFLVWMVGSGVLCLGGLGAVWFSRYEL